MIAWILAWLLTGAAVVVVLLCIDNPHDRVDAAWLAGWAVVWPLAIVAWFADHVRDAVRRKRHLRRYKELGGK